MFAPMLSAARISCFPTVSRGQDTPFAGDVPNLICERLGEPIHPKVFKRGARHAVTPSLQLTTDD
jgi:hypothetical protein